MIPRIAFLLTLPILFAFAATAQERQADDLDGRWIAVELETEGQKEDPKVLKTFRVRVFGNQLTMRPNGTVTRSMKFKLDPSQTPKTIDLTVYEDDKPGRTVQGIYSLDKGQLKMCVPSFDSTAKDAKVRPREFKTKAGDGLVMMVLTRSTK